MWIEALIVAMIFGLGSLLGVPVAWVIGRRRRAMRFAPLDKTTIALFERREITTRTFEPIDFGPMLMKWPSEMGRVEKGVPEPDWPSQSWNDTHFGQWWRDRDGDAVSTSRRERAQPVTSERVATPRPAKKRPQRQRQTPPPQAVRQQSRPAQPRKSNTSPSGLPEPAVLKRMVDKNGLAHTVQFIMQKTGWDFRESAQFLAKIRRS